MTCFHFNKPKFQLLHSLQGHAFHTLIDLKANNASDQCFILIEVEINSSLEYKLIEMFP